MTSTSLSPSKRQSRDRSVLRKTREPRGPQPSALDVKRRRKEANDSIQHGRQFCLTQRLRLPYGRSVALDVDKLLTLCYHCVRSTVVAHLVGVASISSSRVS